MASYGYETHRSGIRTTCFTVTRSIIRIGIKGDPDTPGAGIAMCRRSGERFYYSLPISGDHEPIEVFKTLINTLYDPRDAASYTRWVKPAKVVVYNDGYAEILQKHIPDLSFEQTSEIDRIFGVCDFRFTKPDAKSLVDGFSALSLS